MTKAVGKQIARAALIIMMATLLGRVLGLVREQVIAFQFGASLASDAYKVAYTLPYIFGVMVTGAFNAAFIPLFTEAIQEQDRTRAWRLGSAVLNLVFIVFLVFTILGEVFTPLAVHLTAPDFQGQAYTLTLDLMRIIFPTLIFAALAGITSGMLNSMQHFLIPALGPIVSSIAVILSAFTLVPVMGIHGLAVGTLIGFFLQFAIQIPILMKKGFQYALILDVKNPTIRRMGRLIIPVLVGVGVGQITIIVDQRFASGLAEGSVAALNFANRMMQLPLGLFVSALVVPLFPALSAFAAKKDLASIKVTAAQGVNLLGMVMVPATVGLMLLAQPIVRLLLERGAFDQSDTQITAVALFFLSIGMTGFAVREIFTRVFYSLKDTTTPVVIAAIAVTINVVLNFLLVERYGLAALAFSTSLATYVNITLQGWFLRKRIGALFNSETKWTWLKIGLSSLTMGIVVETCVWLFNLEAAHLTTMGQVFRVGGTIAIGGLVYAGAILLLRIPEAQTLVNAIAGKLRRARPSNG